MEKTHNSPSIACFREKDETKDLCVRENKSERKKKEEREMIVASAIHQVREKTELCMYTAMLYTHI